MLSKTDFATVSAFAKGGDSNLIGHFLKKGRGAPYVFLHGFLGNAMDWSKVIAHMKRRTCMAYDLPGHGQMNWVDMEIDDLMPSALPPGPVHLVGYSLGGRLALRYALKNPSRVRSLTLLSTHYGLPTEEERQARLQQDRVWAQKILTLSFDRFLREWYDQPVFSSLKQNVPLRQEIFSMRQNPRPKDLYRALVSWSLGRQPYYRDTLRALPCRIFCGERDEKFLSLYQGWPQARIVPGAGHCIHLENPKTLAELLVS